MFCLQNRFELKLSKCSVCISWYVGSVAISQHFYTQLPVDDAAGVMCYVILTFTETPISQPQYEVKTHCGII